MNRRSLFSAVAGAALAPLAVSAPALATGGRLSVEFHGLLGAFDSPEAILPLQRFGKDFAIAMMDGRGKMIEFGAEVLRSEMPRLDRSRHVSVRATVAPQPAAPHYWGA